MKNELGLVAVLAVSAVGCMPTGSVANGSALVHSQFPYAVSYDDERSKSVLGEEWTLENYRVASAKADGSLELERKDGYETTYELDFDDDDKEDAEAKLPNPDLVFLHRRTNARLEVTTLLLDKRLADKELRVLLSDIVEKESGTRSLFVGFGKVAAGVQKRFASKLLESSEATLGNEKGLVATIERADLDQLQLNPNARWRRSRLFLVRAPFDYYATKSRFGEPGLYSYHKYRVLLLVEYSNTPEDFEAQYPDLVRLLNKIHLLSDDMLLDYLAEPLLKCGDKTKLGKITIQVSSIGEPLLAKTENIDRFCAGPVIEAYRFAAKGERREIEHSYDFSKPLKPAWLATTGGYKEERGAPPDAAGTSPRADAAPAEASPAATEPAPTGDPPPESAPAVPSAESPAPPPSPSAP